MNSTSAVAATTTTLYKRKNNIHLTSVDMATTTNKNKLVNGNVTNGGACASSYRFDPSFMKWTINDVVNVVKIHWLPCFFGLGLFFFMAVEFTLLMVPASSPPFDLGFIATNRLNQMLSSWPELNTLLAFLNTVFFLMQCTYILWTWLIEGRPRAIITALFTFTCRAILGYSTQLPLPQGFVGSAVDFPIASLSFFLFFSGHVAGAVIASLDMRRMQRWELAWTYDVLNVLQAVRLLGIRGHYTIDLAAGAGAGILFDSLAGKYEECKRNQQALLAKQASLFT